MLSESGSEDFKLLAAYSRMKQAYVNSRINNYDPRTVAKRENLKWTVGTVKRWVPRLIEKGYAFMDGSDLVLISKHNLARKYPTKTGKIGFFKFETNDYVNELYARSLTNHLSRMLHRKVESMAQSKSIRRKLKKQYRGQGLSISTSKLSKLWKVSKSTANRITAVLSRSNLIYKETFEKDLVAIMSKAEWANRDGLWKTTMPPITSCYWYKGYVFYKEASIYISLLDRNT